MNHVVDILSLEERTFNAWPALQSETVSGWIFRFAGGFTKRANSVNALAPTGDFAAVLSTAVAAYARETLPAIFRLTPLAPPDADTILDASGYTRFDPSFTMIAPIADYGICEGMTLATTPSGAWLAGFAEANRVDPLMRLSHDAIVRRIRQPAAFVTAHDSDGRPAGYGLGVYERGMVGLFDIVVAPAARGSGAGRALTRSILQWGRSMGANQAYLNVRSINTVALSLYESLGFKEAFAYHYRMPPE